MVRLHYAWTANGTWTYTQHNVFLGAVRFHCGFVYLDPGAADPDVATITMLKLSSETRRISTKTHTAQEQDSVAETCIILGIRKRQLRKNRDGLAEVDGRALTKTGLSPQKYFVGAW